MLRSKRSERLEARAMPMPALFLSHSRNCVSLYVKTFAITLSVILLSGIVALHGALSSASDDTREATVTVKFGDVDYHIPRAYVLGVTPFSANSPQAQVGSGYASFTMGVLLPDFQPAR
jgi:hypothetical protein